MVLYYLENQKDTQLHLYYRTGGDCGGEHYDGTNELTEARFFLDKETAESHIANANNWWTKYDFKVKSITADELMEMVAAKKPNVMSFAIEDWSY